MGGNDKFNNFLKEYNVPKTLPITQKYETSAAKYFRERLNAEVNGLPLPASRPERYQASSKSSSADAKGSDPIPGETEAEYVARQRRLQEEVSELAAMQTTHDFICLYLAGSRENAPKVRPVERADFLR